MATAATALQPQQQTRPVAQRPDQSERSQSAPQTFSPEEVKQQFGLTTDLENVLLECWQLHREMWFEQKDLRIRKALRGIEYDNGNQYISWDPASGSYLSPFNDVTAGSVFDRGGERVYSKVTNVVQWARKITVAVLTRAVPHTEFWPSDSNSDLDNRSAKAKTQASRKIGRDNNEDELLELGSEHLFLTGSYFRHVYWSMDGRANGTRMEPELGWQDKPLLPARYQCPSCGMEVPAPPLQQGQEPPPVICPQCGQKLNSGHFYGGVSVKMPVVVGQREVPIGMVRQDLWNLLNVDSMPNVDTSKGNPILRLPMLDLQLEITKGAFRTMYPGAWEQAFGQSESGGVNESTVARDARQRAASPGSIASMAMSDRMPTYHRLWLNEEFCRMHDNHDLSEQLAELVTKDGKEEGCCAVILNRKIIDIQYSGLSKSWTWCGTKRGSGLYPPALVEPGLDIQDRINDRSNSVDEYHDRMGCPPILYNPQIITAQLSGKFLPPGTMTPAPANPDASRKLSDAFFQAEFHQDNGVYQWLENALTTYQLLIGCQPQMYGGSDKNIKTAAGQAQALSTATAILLLTLKQMRRENANASQLSVDCLIANQQGGITSVQRDESAVGGGGYRTDDISQDDLTAGTTQSFAEASEGIPVSYDDQRQMYSDLLSQAGKNPLIEEVLGSSYELQRTILRYVGPSDAELPQKKARDKVLRDIGILIDGEPKQGLDPVTQQPIMVPSVSPDSDTDSPTLESVSIPLVTDYMLENYQLSETSPKVFENLRLYLKACRSLSAQQAAKAQLTQAAAQPAGEPQQ